MKLFIANNLDVPVNKFEKSFACFTARDWINAAFEIKSRPCSDFSSELEANGFNIQYSR